MVTRQDLERSCAAIMQAVDAAEVTRQHLPGEPPTLTVALGKAAVPMAKAALRKYGSSTEYLTITRDGYGGEPGELTVTFTSHPVPDERSQAAGHLLLERARALTAKDTLLVLLSGGGSSLAVMPRGVSLSEKQELNQALLRSGASVVEMNTVRKHLSALKGGQLAAATEARVRTIVLSDVPGDDLSMVASGPTAPDESSFTDALRILDAYRIDAPAARRHLEDGVAGLVPETAGRESLPPERVSLVLAASNYSMLRAAAAFWEVHRIGPRVQILSDRFTESARDLARFHAEIVRTRVGHPDEAGVPTVIVSGGEAAVTVSGDGRGGPNQEFSVALARELDGVGRWIALACDSDGVDGNTTAAGGIVDGRTIGLARRRGADVDLLMQRNDSHALLELADALFVPGPTDNNLNDLRMVVTW